MKYAHLAKQYRLEGRYLLALSSAQSSHSPAGRIEECRALCWLAQYKQAHNRLNALSRPVGLERIDYDHAVIICAINLGDWSRCRQLIPTLEHEFDQPHKLDVQIRLHQMMALICGVLDETAHSIEHADMALVIAESFADARLLCDSVFSYADSLHRAQRYSEATAYWNRCLELQKQCLRSDHPELALTLDAFALSLRQLNQAETAIALHLKAQEIYHEALPPFHPALGASYHGLSQALLRCGKRHQAVRNMRLALQCAQKNLPPDHPDIAITQFELGRSECSIGEHQAGLERMTEALQSGESTLGSEHPMVQRMREWIHQISSELSLSSESSEGLSSEDSDSSDASESS